MTTEAPRTLSSKGRQTQQAIEAQPGSCSPNAVFTAPPCPTSPPPRDAHRRCSTATSATRRICSPRWPSRSCTTWSSRPGLSGTPFAESPQDDGFFVSVVSGYWEMFKQHIGIMVAVDNSPPPRPDSPRCRIQFRQFGIDIVAASVRRAQRTGPRRGPERRAHRAGDRAALRTVHHGVPAPGHRRPRSAAVRRGSHRHPVHHLEDVVRF